MDYSPTRLLRLWDFSRQESWSGLPFPSPGDLPNPGIDPPSPALQADDLPSEPPGKTLLKIKVKVAQSCLSLCDTMDYAVKGILQARILEWVAFSFSRGSSQARDRTQVSCIAGGFFTSWATREALNIKHRSKYKMGFPGGASDKEPACQCRRRKRHVPSPDGRIPWRRTRQPTPVFWPGDPHGQRSLTGLQSIGSQRVGPDWVT